MKEHQIPIVVGVTGHRDLCPAQIPALEEAVRKELRTLRKTYPSSPLWMLSSLAAGADQLCAGIALQEGYSLCCPLPMDLEDYKKDFSGEELPQFESLLRQAEAVFPSPHTEPELPGKDYLYRQAGIYVASHSHVLLAIWTGKPGTAHGCGTAEAVDFMLHGQYRDGKLFHAANDGAVLHISASRQSEPAQIPVAVTLLENEPGSLRDVLEKTECFNREVLHCGKHATQSLLPEAYLQKGLLHRLQGVYDTADRLSMKCQTQYLSIMGILAGFSVLLVLLYLLYDELELNWCLAAFGGTMALYALFFRLIAGRRQHEKYLQYRSLAEALRIQLYLAALGVQENVCDNFTWTQKHESTWVKEAVCALLVGGNLTESVPMDDVKAAWIDGQRAYHRRACGRTQNKHRIQERTTRAMLICTVLTWAAVLILEFFFCDAMTTVVAGFGLRTWSKVLWGCLSAVTVFVSGFYGKLSLERKHFDHEKMAILFDAAAQQYAQNPPQRLDLFRQLAREELIENGNWVSYCRENTPDFSV